MTIETVKRSLGREVGIETSPIGPEQVKIKTKTRRLLDGRQWEINTNVAILPADELEVNVVTIRDGGRSERTTWFRKEEINSRRAMRMTKVREPKKPWRSIHLRYAPDN